MKLTLLKYSTDNIYHLTGETAQRFISDMELINVDSPEIYTVIYEMYFVSCSGGDVVIIGRRCNTSFVDRFKKSMLPKIQEMILSTLERGKEMETIVHKKYFYRNCISIN